MEKEEEVELEASLEILFNIPDRSKKISST